MGKIKGKWDHIFSLPKTVVFNFKMFPFSVAKKLPVFISRKTDVSGVSRGTVRIEAPPERGLIQFGFGGSAGLPGSEKGYLITGKNAQVIFKGKAVFSEGCTLRCDGKLTIGHDFLSNKHTYISCGNEMVFGSRVRVGWDAVIRDSDGHKVYGTDGALKENKRMVTIGDHVWICSYAHVLRCSVADGCIVAWRSCMLKSVDEPNCIIGGYPAKILERGISWSD